jgi:hypothetical protein
MAEAERATVPKIDRDAIYTVATAATATGFGDKFIREAIKTQKLVARRFGPKLIKIKGADLSTWFDAQPTISESMASCPREKDGSPSGGSETQPASPAEKGHASASREQRV